MAAHSALRKLLASQPASCKRALLLAKHSRGPLQFWACRALASSSHKLEDQLPGLRPLPGEKLVPWDPAAEEQMAVWPRLPLEIRESLLDAQKPGLGFQAWLGPEHSAQLVPGDFLGSAGVYKLFTDAEAQALIALTATEEGEHVPSKEETAKKYVGRYNTLRQAVKDKWLMGALWQRLSHNPGALANMEYWHQVVGANADLRLVRTQPPRGDERAGQHLKHVDTREMNNDFVDVADPDLRTRISVITVQCYLNPEEHEGGEFVVWPPRLNLADPQNKRETILYESVPQSNPDLVAVKIRLRNGEAVVFHQDTDQCYHGGAPVTGDEDKVALRFVLDMQRKDVPTAGAMYKEPEYGLGFTNDRTSINLYRETPGTERNTINCVERQRRT